MPWVEPERIKETVSSEEFFIFPTTRKNDRFLLALSEDQTGEKVTKPQPPVKRITPSKLELCYRIDGIVARCVNFYVSQVVGPGFELIDCSQNDKNFTEEFMERDHTMLKIEDQFRDACKGGNGWLEKKFTKGKKPKFVETAYINFKWMDFQRDANNTVIEDEYGEIKGYVFKDYTGKPNNLNPEQIAHLKLFGQGNELAYGFIEPIFQLIYDKVNARRGISQAGWRAGHELLIARMGDKPDNRIGYPGHKADTATAQALADELEDIQGKHKLVIPHYIDIQKIEGTKIDWSPLLNHFDTRICAGFGIPSELILGGVGRANRATLEIAITRDVDREIKSFQNKITIMLQNDIFAQLKEQGDIKKIPNIRWNYETTPADLNRLAKRLTEYIQFGVVNPEDVRDIVYELEDFGKPTPIEEKPKPKGKEEEKPEDEKKPKGIPEEDKPDKEKTDKSLQEMVDFVIEQKHIEPEQAILFLKALKNSFPSDTVNKLIDSLIEQIMLKITGQQIPQESQGIDQVQDGEENAETV